MRLIEPFAGAGSVSLSTLCLKPLWSQHGSKTRFAREIIEAAGIGRPSSIHLNDAGLLAGLALRAYASPAPVYEECQERLWGIYRETPQGYYDYALELYRTFGKGHGCKTPFEALFTLAWTCFDGQMFVGAGKRFGSDWGDKNAFLVAPSRTRFQGFLKNSVPITVSQAGYETCTPEPGDVVYLDPPYQGSDSVYNHADKSLWTGGLETYIEGCLSVGALVILSHNTRVFSELLPYARPLLQGRQKLLPGVIPETREVLMSSEPLAGWLGFLEL